MVKREKLLIFTLTLLLLLIFSASGRLSVLISPWLLTVIAFLIYFWILQVKATNCILIGLGVLVAAIWPLWLKQEALAEQMGNLAYLLLFVGVIGETVSVILSKAKDPDEK